MRVLAFLPPLLPLLAIALVLYANDRERNPRLHPAFEDEAVAVLVVSAVIFLILGLLVKRRGAGLLLTALSLGVAFFGFVFGTIGTD